MSLMRSDSACIVWERKNHLFDIKWKFYRIRINLVFCLI